MYVCVWGGHVCGHVCGVVVEVTMWTKTLVKRSEDNNPVGISASRYHAQQALSVVSRCGGF